MKRLWFIFLIAFCVDATCAYSEDSIEDLLNQADDALKGVSSSARKTEGTTSHIQGPPAPTRRRRMQVPETPAEAQESRPPVDTTKAFTPIENPQLDKIVSLDFETKEAERRKARNYAAISLMAGVYALGTGFEMEKDEDYFTVNRGTGLKGVLLQATTPRVTFTRPSAPWGYQFGARAGYFYGDVAIRRHGVVNARQDYAYEVVPIDFYSSLSYVFWKRFNLQLTAGFGGDFYHQKGTEDVDTLTEFGLGPILGFSSTVQITPNISIVGMINRRGFSAESNGRSIAGTTIAVGTEVGMFF